MSPRRPEPIETRVDGEFKGWEGDTVFQLESGQIWLQRGAAVRHTYRVSPRVVIEQAETGCMLRVDGADESVAVERLR